ncbi:MAG: Old Yellow Enzyme family NADH:flavin oxidoreductase [Rhodobacteraceae bacterium HLUCCA12]|nr:MAG: Old Yellow Enzyme family NADH:flavin oxidoreductase [Rhodobacteraceae bacterium HLUCCA12]
MTTAATLFSPFTLGPLRLENRIVASPMCQYSAVAGRVQPWHLVHLGGLALSGAGLVIAEATAVNAQGRITHGCLGLYDASHEAALGAILAQIRAFSPAALGIQLSHAGRRASARSIFERSKGESLPPDEGAWETVAPSALPVAPGWHRPRVMTGADIAQVIDDFAAAAARADRAGFDLVEIHAAHGYLLHQFLSPLTNRRTDDWGGDQPARNRLLIEVVRAVRAALPATRALGVRMTSTDWHPDGLTLDDAVALAQTLAALGVDYAVMSAGNLTPDVRIPAATPGHQVPFAARIRERAGLATMAVGQILDGPQAQAIVAEGGADLVAIARALLDDPRWAWHAAAALGVDIDYPPQYIRARPNNWTGYALVHGGAPEIASARQADRPPTALWDRPQATTDNPKGSAP